MARKLNKKFVIALAAVATLGAGALLAFQVPVVKDAVASLWKEDIATLQKRGDDAVAAGDYHAAAAAYGSAAFRAKTDVPLQIKFVDAYDHTIGGDREKMDQLRRYYSAIFQTDQSNIDIMRRMLRLQVNDVRSNPRLREPVVATAERILKQVPDDREARKALVTAILEPFQRNLEVSAEDVEKALESAEKLYAEDPNDADALLMIVRFRLQQADNARLRNDMDALKTELTKAQVLADAAMKQSPEMAAAHFAGYHVYRGLARLTPDLPNAKRQEIARQADAHLAKADELATPDGDADRFLQIRWFAIRTLELKDPKQAEQRYRQLVDELPNHRHPRLLLAQYLAKIPDRREDAIAILESKWKPIKAMRGLDSMEQSGFELNEKLRLDVIRLASLDQMKDPEARKKRLRQVEESYARLNTMRNQVPALVPWLHRIEGGIAMEQGRVSEAIQQYDDALKMLAPDSPASIEQELRNEVLADFAFAHLKMGQTGKARPALQELVSRDPANIVARVKLIELYIFERQAPQAKELLDPLLKIFPDNPAVNQLWVNLQAINRDTLAGDYEALPEASRPQRLKKLQSAALLEKYAEVSRLAQLMLSEDPGDADAAAVLANSLVRQEKRDEALAVLDGAIKARPDNKRLELLRDSYAADTPEERQKLLEQKVAEIDDPYRRELARAELQLGQGSFDQAIGTLRKAEAMDATDTRAVEMLFETYAAAGRVEEAEQTLKRLSTLNYDPVKTEESAVKLLIVKANKLEGDAQQAQLAEAILQASKVAQKYGDIASPNLLYAQLLHNARNFAEAAEQYAQTIEKSPTNISALRGSASTLIELGRIAEARARLQEAMRIYPNDAGLRQLELDLEINHGDPLRAIDTLTDVWQKNPDQPQAWLQLGIALERVARNKAARGQNAESQKFLEQAGAHWAKAREKFPDDVRMVAAYAQSQRALGKPENAEKAFEQLASSDQHKDDTRIIEALSEQYAISGKWTEAEKTLRDYLSRIKPPPSSALIRLAMLYAQNNQANEALQVLEIKKDDPVVRRQRIELLMRFKQIEAARRAVEEGLASEPNPDMFLLAAFIEVNARRFDQADGFLAKVLKDRPNDPAALFYRAMVRLGQNPPNVQGAREDLQKVVTTNPSNIEARLMLADIYSRRGQSEEAIRELEKAWQLNRTQKAVLSRLLDAYLTALPPRYTNAQQAIDQAKESEQLARDVDIVLAEANLNAVKTPPNPKKAKELAQLALSAAPDNPQLLQRYFETLLKARLYRELIRESDPVLAKNNDAAWLYRLRGMAYRRDARRAEAKKEFDAAFNLAVASQDEQAITGMARTIASELSPAEAIERVEPLINDSLSARLLLAQLHQAANDPNRALEQLERLIHDRQRLRPEQLRVTLQMLGNAYLQVAPPAPDRALKTFEELLADNPNDLLLLNNLAYVHTIPGSGGNKEKALEYSTRAYELTQKLEVLDEQALYVWDTHGWVLVQSGKLREGTDILRRAAEQAEFPEVHLHLAEAYMKSENIADLDRARDALETAQRIIERLETEKKPIDPTVRPKYDQLSAELEGKRRIAAPQAG